MPIYEYKCNQCGNVFEQLVFSCDEVNTYCCPSCGKDDTCKLMSSFCCGSSDSTISTTSKRPRVAKLSLQTTPGHSFLIFAETVLATCLNFLGSANASGETRLSMTYVAISHLTLPGFIVVCFHEISDFFP